MRLYRFLVYVLSFYIVVFTIDSARSQQLVDTCIRKYIASDRPLSLGIAPSDAAALVKSVSNSIGLDSSAIELIPCDFADKALAYRGNGKNGVPLKNYIVYNPRWVQEVVGDQRVHAVALFGHELGHFLNGHFDVNSALPLKEKEQQADRFAGCAVARLSGDLQSLKDLFSRLRDSKSESYPNRLESLTAAQEGFGACYSGSIENDKKNYVFVGTEKSFCADVNAIFATSKDNFITIREPSDSPNMWPTKAHIGGFNYCVIIRGNSNTFSCISDQKYNNNNLIKNIEIVSSKIRQCSSILFREDNVNGSIFLNNAPERLNVILSSVPDTSTQKSETLNRITLNIYRSNNTKIENQYSDNNLPEAIQPEVICDDISSALRSASNSFTDIHGIYRKETDSYASTLKIGGWTNCNINSYDASSHYLSCSLDGRLKDFQTATEIATKYSDGLLQCLGPKWSKRIRRNSSGGITVVTESAETKSNFELRIKNVDGTISLKFDVNDN